VKVVANSGVGARLQAKGGTRAQQTMTMPWSIRAVSAARICRKLDNGDYRCE